MSKASSPSSSQQKMVKIMKICFDASVIFIVGFAMNVFLSLSYLSHAGFFKICAAIWKIEFLLAETVKHDVTFMISKQPS